MCYHLEMQTKIVIDTSVIISALIGKKGPSREILRRCLNGVYQPIISNALFQECEDVSKRKHVIKKCPLTEGEIKVLLSSYYQVCKWIPIYYLWRPNLIDEDDNFLIEVAVAGGSGLIITNNIKDLKGSELKFKGLEVLTPEQFLRGH